MAKKRKTTVRKQFVSKLKPLESQTGHRWRFLVIDFEDEDMQRIAKMIWEEQWTVLYKSDHEANHNGRRFVHHIWVLARIPWEVGE